MRIQIMSDLHLEFGGGIPRVQDVDVAICAGDLAPYESGLIERLRDTWWNADEVIYVLGNHEFYGMNMTEVREEAEHEASIHGVHLLDPGAVWIDNVRFIGATLWTDFGLYGPGDEFRCREKARKGINDYRGHITVGDLYADLTPEMTQEIHRQEVDWIDARLCRTEGEKCVVITHHAPTSHSINEKFVGQSLNASYASNLDKMIENWQPTLWIHGHMHDAVDKMLGDTRLICNPRGYSHEKNRGFRDDLVVEI